MQEGGRGVVIAGGRPMPCPANGINRSGYALLSRGRPTLVEKMLTNYLGAVDKCADI